MLENHRGECQHHTVLACTDARKNVTELLVELPRRVTSVVVRPRRFCAAAGDVVVAVLHLTLVTGRSIHPARAIFEHELVVNVHVIEEAFFERPICAHDVAQHSRQINDAPSSPVGGLRAAASPAHRLAASNLREPMRQRFVIILELVKFLVHTTADHLAVLACIVCDVEALAEIEHRVDFRGDF